MQKDDQGPWASIRQYRKSLQPVKRVPYLVLPQTNDSPFSKKSISFSQNRSPFSCHSDESREHDKNISPYMIHQGVFSSKKPSSSQDEVVIASGTKSKETQRFALPMFKEQEISEKSSHTTLEISPPGWTENSLIGQVGAGPYMRFSMINDEETADCGRQKQEDMEDVKKNLCVDVREFLVEDNEETGKDLQISKGCQLDQMKKEKFAGERENFQTIYNKIEEEIERKYQQKLQEKDNEIRALRLGLSIRTSEKRKENDYENMRKRIQEYEELMDGLRREYEEKLINSERYYRQKTMEYMKERSELVDELEELREEIKKLKRNICGEARPRLVKTHRDEKDSNKTAQGKRGAKCLLDKINRYMEENSIENEVTVSNRKKLYRKICKVESAREHRLEGKNNENPEDSEEWTVRDFSLKEDRLNHLCSKSKQEEGRRRNKRQVGLFEINLNKGQAPVDTESSESNLIMSVKNLQHLLRFKPKVQN